MSEALIIPFEPIAPEPLIRPIEKGAPFPIECLPQALRDGVEGIVAAIQCPVALAANSVLGAASLVAQAHVNVATLHGSIKPSSLFFMTIAASGERKSSADDLAMRSVKAWEVEQVKASKKDFIDYKCKSDVYEMGRKSVICAKSDRSKGFDSEAVEEGLKALGPPPEPPPLPNLICDEPTIEGLFRLLGNGLGTVGVFSSEGGAFVGGHAMNKDNRLKTAALVSSAWDGEAIRRVRASESLPPLFGRRVSMHLMGQPKAMAGLLDDESLRDQGILARFLWSAPDSTMGSRFYKEVSSSDHLKLASFHNVISGCLDRDIPRPKRDIYACEPKTLTLSPEAKEILIKFSDDVEKKLAKGGELESITGTGAKLAEQALRLAGVFTFVSDPDANVFSAECIKNACTLAHWFGQEALRLFNAYYPPPLKSIGRKY